MNIVMINNILKVMNLTQNYNTYWSIGGRLEGKRLWKM